MLLDLGTARNRATLRLLWSSVSGLAAADLPWERSPVAVFAAAFIPLGRPFLRRRQRIRRHSLRAVGVAYVVRHHVSPVVPPGQRVRNVLRCAARFASHNQAPW